MRHIVSIVLGLLLTAAGHSPALAASAFTYQGELVYNAVPADGSYGQCVDCGKPIAAARLAVSPAARRCIACQQRVEKAGSAPPTL